MNVLSYRQSPRLFTYLLTIFLVVSTTCVCLAQRTTQEGLRSRVMERLDDEEAAQMLQSFKAQRLDKNYCFQFQLEHKPRKGRTVRYEGILYGSWNMEGPITRVKLFPNRIDTDSPEMLSPIDMIVQNGFSPKVWVRQKNSERFTLINDQSLFEPIFDGIVYTPFDLQLPFIFWNRYTYEGPSRVLSRIGHKFLMFPPERSLAEQHGVSAVRISVDDTYYALLRAEVMQGGKERSQFTVRGIKKIQDRYIVREVELKNLFTKDATTFKVKAAGIGMAFADSIFDPQSPGEPVEFSENQLETL